jgi:hypothetical protein
MTAKEKAVTNLMQYLKVTREEAIKMIEMALSRHKP